MKGPSSRVSFLLPSNGKHILTRCPLSLSPFLVSGGRCFSTSESSPSFPQVTSHGIHHTHFLYFSTFVPKLIYDSYTLMIDYSDKILPDSDYLFTALSGNITPTHFSFPICDLIPTHSTKVYQGVLTLVAMFHSPFSGWFTIYPLFGGTIDFLSTRLVLCPRCRE